MFQRGIGVLALAAVAAWGVFRDPAAPVKPADAAESTAAPGATQADAAAEPTGFGIQLLRAHGYPSLSGTLDVLVVTLPDPIASHLDWAFDSHLDAVRRAFERAGYVLDRFDLPWKPAKGGEPSITGRPGVLLFRRSDLHHGAETVDFWLVYLVGELSTRGLDPKAFELALRERGAIAKALAPGALPDAAPLRIVGPTFSGVSRSLRGALARARTEKLHTGPVLVVSGAATSDDNREQIEDGGTDLVEFRSTVQTDGSFLREFAELLRDFDLEAEQVAILQEGTTAYGASLDTTRLPLLVVPFPMSIGSLRRASTVGSGGRDVATGFGLDSAQTRTALDLTEEAQRLETVGATTKLTPASIDLLLDEMTRTLAQRDIKAALLFASDVRDKLFLGSELKKRLPDLQLFTFEGNVLYLRPEYNPWLRGMVVLSTYPLLLRDARWRPQSPGMPGENLLFANEGAEGTFNATLSQLEQPALLADYTSSLDPAATTSLDRPGTWATIVGATMMLPLTLAASTGPTSTPHAAAAKPPVSGARDRRVGKPISILILAWIALVTVAILWKAFLDRRIRSTGKLLDAELPVMPERGFEGHDLSQQQLEQASLSIHHHMYRAVLHFALLSLLLPLLPLIVADDPFASVSTGFAAALLAVGSLVSAFVVLSETRAASRLARRYGPAGWNLVKASLGSVAQFLAWPAEIFLRALVGLGTLLLAAFTIGLAWQIHVLGDDCQRADLFRLFLHRTVEVDQGVSLLVPLTLMGLLAAAWARWHLYRLGGLARPEPAARVLADAGIPCDEVRASLFRVLPAPGAVLLLAALVPAGVWALLQFGRTHDGALLQRAGRVPLFDWLLGLGILAALLGSVWAAYRVVSIWTAFRRVLSRVAGPIASLPFADLRQALGLHVSLGLWPSVHSGDLRAMAATRWRVFAADAAGRPSPFGSATALLGTLPDARTPHQELTPEERAQQLERFLADYLRECPRRIRTKPVESGDDEPPATRASKEVLAGELVLYFESIVRQLRVLCFLLLVSVVLTTLLVNSYPFRPQQLFQTTSLFVFAGVIACLVWVISSMNRNPTLSRASGSKPGELTWDRTLLANLALYAIVPILALVTSQNPALRDKLFEWVKPLVQFLVTA